MPNKLSQFWQELKRRNVTRVLAVYIAAAFMLLELISMFSEQIGLPDGTWKVAFIISLAGLVLVVIVSWVYDIHPVGGLVKTEPAQKVLEESVPPSSKGWKIASYISFVVIVGLIVLNIIPRLEKKEILNKSIAVLPFINDSPDEDNEHIISGCMTSVLNNLSKIKELRVINRPSVERYKNTTKSIREIAEELDVSYLIYARGQKFGNRIVLTVQLIDKEEELIWSNPYDRQITKVEDIFTMLSEIAQQVAGEIEAIITPEEQDLIRKIPTTNSTAYEFYQRGMDEYWKYSTLQRNTDVLKNALPLFRYALDYDSTFALAYSGMAQVYYFLESSGESFFTEVYLDTVLILADKALSFDPQLSDAYSIKGTYYREREVEKALYYYDKALEHNPNDWSAYWGKAQIYHNDDLLKTIDNINQAVSRSRGPALPGLLYRLGYTYYTAGIMDKGDSIFREYLKVSGDSAQYLFGSGSKEYMVGNQEGKIEYDKKAYESDTSDQRFTYYLGLDYSDVGQFERAVYYLNRAIEMNEASGRVVINEMHRVGYAYWMNGDKEKGSYYLNMQKEYCESSIRLGRTWAEKLYFNYDLAGIYAFQGERDKAYENLRIFNQRDKMPQWMANLIKYDPLFDSLRDEPEFQQIVRDVEAKYQAEHQRVRQWLEKNDML